ncbi:multidrug ABC transporter permease [Gordoniibacillus kamchatkensis]|uniref:Multidrug ABC transporter permease n=1 Tax=Gordoniibacillus kamchatkensis TaxID=1590651 RepID=A0ABR5AIX6_9BACL|nr:ABC transporter permease [Paenibacillus sp. VKM B-2647]KIL40974.1 multidrug ABC transporter permease [Paenibacillus sp. VKM B-2647]
MRPTVGTTIAREWLHIVKDKRLFMILFAVPLLYTALFGSIYVHHKVTELATVVVDEDRSPLSRQIVQAFDEHESFRIVREAYSEDEAQAAIANGSAKVALIVPAHFEARVKAGQTLPLVTLIDGSNMMISNTATKAAGEVITTFSMGLSGTRLKLQQGLQDAQVMNTLAPIPYRYRILYNPAFNYSEFMMFGLTGAVFQQVLFLGIALTISREKEAGTWASYAVWRREPWLLAYAKTVPYFLINLFNTIVSYVLCAYVFHIPLNGPLWAGIVLIAAFTFAVCGYGYLISMFSGNQLGATQTAMLIAVPSFLLSGYTWPMESMPAALRVLSHGLPLTYFLEGARAVFVKGNGLELIWRDCVALGLMGTAAYLAALLLTRFVVFRKTAAAEAEHPEEAALPALPRSGAPLSQH